MKPEHSPEFLTLDAAARLAGLSHWTIRRMLQTNQSGGRTMTTVILWNSRTTAFELVSLERVPKPSSELSLIGKIELINGRFKTKLEVPLCDAEIKSICAAFVQHVVSSLPGVKDMEN
jgi:hypothetical protein